MSVSSWPDDASFSDTCVAASPIIVNGKPIPATLHKSDREFLVKPRGFHWINEFPCNR